MFTSKPKMKVLLFLYRIDGTLPALSILNDEQSENFQFKKFDHLQPGTTERKKEQTKRKTGIEKSIEGLGKKEGKS
jgi:hypothetical protein